MQNKFLKWYSLAIIEIGVLFSIMAIFPPAVESMILFSTTSFGTFGNSILLAQFILGITGAVMAGWGVTIYYISNTYSEEAKKYLLASMLTWFILDSVLSIITTFYLNLVVNVVFLLAGLYVIRK